MEAPNYMALHGATLAANGYSIIPIQPGTKAPGRCSYGEWSNYPAWSRHCDRATTDFEVDIWRTWPGCAIGIACGTVVGVDIDIDDQEVAFAVEEKARLILGDTPCVRIGRAPKRMLLYRASAPFPSRKTKPLEILAHGTQFVAYAIHPDTGRAYEWPVESPAETDISALPEIDAEMVETFYADAWSIIPATMKRGGHDPNAVPGGYVGTAGASLHGKRGTAPAIKAALDYIPNDGLDRADWIGVGMSLKGALGESGRELWIEWSRSSNKSGASGKTDTPERTWKSLKPHSRGAGSLYYRAIQNGWSPPAGLTLNGDYEDLPIVDFSGLLAKLAPEPGERQEAEAEAERIVTGFPPDLLQVEGTLKLIMDECARTARRPQPILALAAAICAVGALAGRRYRTATDLRTNIYAVGIGESGSGKDNAPNVVRAAIMAAGLQDYLGGEDLASGRGVIGAIAKHPCRLFQIDEFGLFLEGVTGKFAKSHEVAIKTSLMRLFSRVQSTYLGAEYAQQDERQRIDVIQPHACLYGGSTPATFWRAIRAGAMRDGFVARLLVFETDNQRPQRQAGGIIQPSEELITACRTLAAGGAQTGNLVAANGTSFAGRHDHKTQPELRTVPMTARALALNEEWQDRQDMFGATVEGTDMAATVARWGENAIKLALVRAVSRDPQAPQISDGDIDWGWRIAGYSQDIVRAGSRKFVAENQFEADLKRVLDIIESAGMITASELGRQTRSIAPRVRQDILNDLKDQGSIEEVLTPPAPGKRGKPARAYRAVAVGAD